MKPVFNFCKIVSACVFILFVFTYSSHPSSVPFQMEPGVILITGIDAAGNLILRDARGNSVHNRIAQRRESVNWRVRPNSGVGSITEIGLDENVPNNDDVFSVAPHQQGDDPKHWRGIIADLDDSRVYEEKYFIRWTDSATGETHLFDPKIQVNPAPKQ